MKFVINREKILGPLSRVCKVIEQHPTIPLLSHCYMRAEGGALTLTGSRIEVEVSETIKDVETDDFCITFPANSAQKFCNRLPEGVDLVFEQAGEDELLINIEGGVGGPDANNFRTKLLDASSFPRIASGEWTGEFQVSRSELSELLNKISFAMATNESRFYLNAMMLEISDKTLRGVATDAHRLATCVIETVTDIGETCRVIVPNKTINDLRKLLPELVSTITVRLSPKHISISTPQVQFISKLLEAQYPDWRAVIPANLTRSFESDYAQIESAFMRANIIAESANVAIGALLDIGERSIKLHTESASMLQSIGSSMLQQVNATIPTDYDGERFTINVNCQYIIDIIRAMSNAKKMQFNYANSESACVIKNPDDESTLYLVMLMKD